MNEKVKKQFGIKDENKLHMMYLTNWGEVKGKVGASEDYKDMSDSDIVAYEYETMEKEEKEKMNVIEIKIKAKTKSYNYVSIKEISPPKWFFAKSKEITCRDFKIQIFKYFMHLIEFPQEILE